MLLVARLKVKISPRCNKRSIRVCQAYLFRMLLPCPRASQLDSGILFCLVLRRYTRFDAGEEAIRKLSEIVTYAMAANIFFVDPLVKNFETDNLSV